MSEAYKTKRKAPMTVGEYNVTSGYRVDGGVLRAPNFVNTVWVDPSTQPALTPIDPAWANTNAQPYYWGSPVTITQAINLGQLYGNGVPAYLSGVLDASGNLTLSVDPNYMSTTAPSASGSY